MRKKHLVLILLIIGSYSLNQAITLQGKNQKQNREKTREEKIDIFLSDIYQGNKPGAAVIVTQKGKTVFRKGYGLANLELGIPIKPDMVFRLGSITKQFTATAIMILAEENKISLEDKISKFFPEYSGQKYPITIEHLLSHTSGIKSFTSLENWSALMRTDMSVIELIDLFKEEPLEFRPGEQCKYSNSGYILLGAIIEQVSGMSYQEFIQNKIFDLLEMKNSYYGSHKTIIPNRVSGYRKENSSFINADFISMTNLFAAGSLLSTVDDLAKWNRALRKGQLITKKILQKMVTPVKTSNGQITRYGYGWRLFGLRGQKVIAHSGEINGFSTYALYLPHEDVFIAVLSNCRNYRASPSYISNWIAALMMDKPFKKPKAIELSAKILDKYVGIYKISKDVFRTITRRGNRLFTQRTGGFIFEAFPESETEFFYKYTFVHFNMIFDETGNVTKMIMHTPAGDEEAIKIEKKGINLPFAYLNTLEGTYKFPFFSVIVFQKENRLFIQIDNGKPDEIIPHSKTIFLSRQTNAQFIFNINKNGGPIELALQMENQKMLGKKTE
jgi:CubicO group peptidase (beta-lactamase class C family)